MYAESAARGDEMSALAVIEAYEPAAIAPNAEHARAVLNNGLSLYAAALGPAQSAAAFDELTVTVWSLPELIEAASRVGKTELAGPPCWVGQPNGRAPPVLTGRWGSKLARTIERREETRVRAELARSHLVYGEWLRRENRRRDARQQLRTAHEMLSAMGANAFADRAARELLATSETARKRTVDTGDELTPHETRIARMACDGASNQEIPDQLFVSHKTIEYHLHKVFLKLGVPSREHVDRVLPGG